MAVLIEKSKGNIQGVLEMMEKLPLSKVRKIMDYWNEITLTYEQREQRMRKEGDRLANEALEKLMGGGLLPELNKQVEANASVVEPESTIDRFLSLNIDPSMLKMEIK